MENKSTYVVNKQGYQCRVYHQFKEEDKDPTKKVLVDVNNPQRVFIEVTASDIWHESIILKDYNDQLFNYSIKLARELPLLAVITIVPDKDDDQQQTHNKCILTIYDISKPKATIVNTSSMSISKEMTEAYIDIIDYVNPETGETNGDYSVLCCVGGTKRQFIRFYKVIGGDKFNTKQHMNHDNEIIVMNNAVLSADGNTIAFLKQLKDTTDVDVCVCRLNENQQLLLMTRIPLSGEYITEYDRVLAISDNGKTLSIGYLKESNDSDDIVLETQVYQERDGNWLLSNIDLHPTQFDKEFRQSECTVVQSISEDGNSVITSIDNKHSLTIVNHYELVDNVYKLASHMRSNYLGSSFMKPMEHLLNYVKSY